MIGLLNGGLPPDAKAELLGPSTSMASISADRKAVKAVPYL
jgi:hypothetical protein